MDGLTTFSGTLYNPSTDYVITSVTVKLSVKPDSADAAPQPSLYSAPVEIWPQAVVPFSISLIPGDYDGHWQVTSIHGVSLAEALRISG